MSATSEFLKLRSKGDPQPGQWNYNFKQAMEMAKKDGKTIVTCWSNGDNCSYCIIAERCMANPIFKDWLAQKDVYLVFQYSGDPKKGAPVHDWVYERHRIRVYPGFRISRYDAATGEFLYDEVAEANSLRDNKMRDEGARAMVASLGKMLDDAQSKAPETVPEPEPEPAPDQDYKIRLNEALTTKQVNKILDAIDRNDGYCPCQKKYEGSKCHCEDFLYNKAIGEPCICNIYVKQEK